MLKSYYNKIRTLSYYMGDLNAPRPILGILADFILILMGVFSTLYIWLIYRTRSLWSSLAISLLVTSLLGFALYLRKRGYYKRNRNKMRRSVAREYMENGLSLLSRQEFKWQLISALSAINGLSTIEQRPGYLKAEYNDMPIAIGYQHVPPKGHVSYERVWSFYNSLRSRGYRSLIFISSGYFEDDCNNIMDEDLVVSLSLLDIEDLLDLMEQANMGPREDLLNHLVQERIAKNRRKGKKHKESKGSAYKLKRYMLSSLLFLGASLLFRSYFLFYFVLAIIFFVLALISRILSTDGDKSTSKFPQ